MLCVCVSLFFNYLHLKKLYLIKKDAKIQRKLFMLIVNQHKKIFQCYVLDNKNIFDNAKLIKNNTKKKYIKLTIEIDYFI